MVTVTKESHLFVWDIKRTKKESYIFTLLLKLKKVHLGDVNQIEFSPDSSMFLSCGKDRLVRCYDSESGKVMCNCSKHKDAVFSVAWLSNNKNFVSTSVDGTLRM